MNHIRLLKVENTRGRNRFGYKAMGHETGFLVCHYYSPQKKCVGHTMIPMIVSSTYKSRNLDRNYELHLTPKSRRIRKVIARPKLKVADIQQEICRYYPWVLGMQLQLPAYYESWTNQPLCQSLKNNGGPKGQICEESHKSLIDAIEGFPSSRIPVWL